VRRKILTQSDIANSVAKLNEHHRFTTDAGAAAMLNRAVCRPPFVVTSTNWRFGRPLVSYRYVERFTACGDLDVQIAAKLLSTVCCACRPRHVMCLASVAE